jgi:predicted negative regulator of RcsB-dependent stress response
VSDYLNEDEQLEALKRWWKENGKAVIGGAVLGLAVVGGWQGWQHYSTAQAERASAYFEQFTQAARGDDLAVARQQGERLLQEFENSTYAVLTALELAGIDYQQGQADSAVARLRWALAHADDRGLEQLARLRLARLLLDTDDLDGAAQLADNKAEAAFAGDFAALRGDIARARGDAASARSAYQEALGHGVANPELLEMKLREVGGQPAAG